MLRIIVAERATPVRQKLIQLLDSKPGFEVVGVTDDGRRAVSMTSRLRPSLVLMGIDLKTSDGFIATGEIMIDCPTPILIVSGSHTAHEVDLAVRALRAGALSVIEIPSPNEHFAQDHAAFLAKIEAMAEVKLVRRWREHKSSASRRPRGLEAPDRKLPISLAPASAVAPSTARIVAIASSTGGPAVLEAVLQQLGKDFPAPVLIVQHIATGFIDGVAAWLNRISSLEVAVARHGDVLSAGAVYLAPDDRHLGVSRTGRIQLSHDPPVNGFRPSANHLFESVARAYGRGALAVILTGMGSDGCIGLRAVRGGGGFVIAQDEASSVVFGMPSVAIKEGLVNLILPGNEISQALEELIRER